MTAAKKIGKELHSNVQSYIDRHYDADLAFVIRDRMILNQYAEGEQRSWSDSQIKEVTQSIAETLDFKRDEESKYIKGVKPNGVAVNPASQEQSEYLQSILSGCSVTAGIGPAGVGKTFLGVAAMLHILDMYPNMIGIITRPMIEVGEKMGFLPGDMIQKTNPYMQPIYDAVIDLGGKKLLEDTNKVMTEAQNTGSMEFKNLNQRLYIVPLPFMRGRNFPNAIILGDEFQNAEPEQIDMFLTRGAKNSQYIICGDITQWDKKHVTANESGLAYFLREYANDKPLKPLSGKVPYLCSNEFTCDQKGKEYPVPENDQINVINFPAKVTQRSPLCKRINLKREKAELRRAEKHVARKKTEHVRSIIQKAREQHRR